jgi:hypothetical protein
VDGVLELIVFSQHTFKQLTFLLNLNFSWNNLIKFSFKYFKLYFLEQFLECLKDNLNHFLIEELMFKSDFQTHDGRIVVWMSLWNVDFVRMFEIHFQSFSRLIWELMFESEFETWWQNCCLKVCFKRQFSTNVWNTLLIIFLIDLRIAVWKCLLNMMVELLFESVFQTSFLCACLKCTFNHFLDRSENCCLKVILKHGDKNVVWMSLSNDDFVRMFEIHFKHWSNRRSESCLKVCFESFFRRCLKGG